MVLVQIIQIAAVLGCILAGRLVLRQMQGCWRDLAFTSLNLGVFYLVFFHHKGGLRTLAFFA